MRCLSEDLEDGEAGMTIHYGDGVTVHTGAGAAEGDGDSGESDDGRMVASYGDSDEEGSDEEFSPRRW